jgi:hypothetical protein
MHVAFEPETKSVEENVYVVLEGSSSLGVSLRSRIGGKGCYIDSFLEENGERSGIAATNVRIGDALISINDDDIQDQTIEVIYHKVQSLSFPLRLHFQRHPGPLLEDILKEISSIRVLCYYSWIKRYIKYSSSDYHSTLAMWVRIFQVTTWMETIFAEETVPTTITHSQLHRIACALIILVPASMSLPDTYALLRHTMQNYLQSLTVRDFLTQLLEAFYSSRDFSRMIAFNPSVTRWKYFSISTMLRSAAGVLALCAALPKSIMWSKFFVAYSYCVTKVELQYDNLENRIEILAKEIEVTLVEKGLFRRVYESDAYYLYLQNISTSTPLAFRRIFSLLPKSFSLHHYQHFNETTYAKMHNLEQINCFAGKSTNIRVELEVEVDIGERTKQFLLKNLSVCDCSSPNDSCTHLQTLAEWRQLLGCREKEGAGSLCSSPLALYLCPQLDSELYRAVREGEKDCKEYIIPTASFVLDQLPCLSTLGNAKLYVASHFSFASNCSNIEIRDIRSSFFKMIDHGKCNFLPRNPSNSHHEGSKLMQDMFALSSRWMQPTRAVFSFSSSASTEFTHGSEESSEALAVTKNLSQNLNSDTASHPEQNSWSFFRYGRSSVPNIAVQSTDEVGNSLEEKAPPIKLSESSPKPNLTPNACVENSGVEGNGMKATIMSLTSSWWNQLKSRSNSEIHSDTHGLKSEIVQNATENELSIDNSISQDSMDLSDSLMITAASEDEHQLIPFNPTISTSPTVSTSTLSVVAEMEKRTEEVAKRKLGTVSCLISSQPTLLSLRNRLWQQVHSPDLKDQNSLIMEDDEWCFDIISESIAPGLLFLLFHAFVLEVSVILVHDDSGESGGSGNLLAVLLTQWLSRTILPLRWPHTIAVGVPCEVVLPLLQCPTPVWLALPRSIYEYHHTQQSLNNVDNTTLHPNVLASQESVMVVDLSRQEVLWPTTHSASLAALLPGSQKSTQTHSNVRHSSSDAMRKEYLCLFRLCQALHLRYCASELSSESEDNLIISSRFAFASDISSEHLTPVFFQYWLRCLYPVSARLHHHHRLSPASSALSSHLDSLQIAGFHEEEPFQNDTENILLDLCVPEGWLQLPSHLHPDLIVQERNVIVGHRFSTKLERLSQLCQVFVQQIIYGMSYLVVDLQFHDRVEDVSSRNGTYSDGCLCLDDDLYLWLKSQQVRYNVQQKLRPNQPLVQLLFGEELYYHSFAKRFLRCQSLSVHLTEVKKDT